MIEVMKICFLNFFNSIGHIKYVRHISRVIAFKIGCPRCKFVVSDAFLRNYFRIRVALGNTTMS